MATLVHDCPHCRAGLMSFVLFGAHKWPETTSGTLLKPRVNVAGECQKCRGPVAAILQCTSSIDPSTWNARCASLLKDAFAVPNSQWSVLAAWPEPPLPVAPEHLPQNIEKAFMQGESNLARPGHEEPAATMFRRALDLALKDKFPELKGDLFKKITALSENHTIPASLADWAHEVRGIGNDGAHDVDGCTQEDAQAARDFVDAVLRYLYSLPGMIADRRPETESAGTDEDAPPNV